METNREKVSYCIGLETGKNIIGQFKDLELELLSKGFSDALNQRTPALERDEIHKIMTALSKQVQGQQREYVSDLSEKNKVEGEAFMDENKSKEGIIALPNGLQYKVLQAGSGPTPSIHDVVTVHYRGSLIDGTVFDSSYEKEEPTKFPVSRVIPGWSEALKMMKVGDKWQLFVPSYLALSLIHI